jgi:hypothetical protein
VNNQVFVAPKNISTSIAETAGRRMLNKWSKKIDELSLPDDGQFRGMPLSEQKRLFAKSIRETGRWVTAPDLKGVRLYADRFPVYRYGEPVVLTWDEFLTASDPEAPPWGDFLRK